MSDEQQPLRLKPRLPAGGDPPPPVALPPPTVGDDQTENLAKLRLKPRLNLSDDGVVKLAPDLSLPPPPPISEAPPPAPRSPVASDNEAIPKIKLRPKNPPPPPSITRPPAFDAPPEPSSGTPMGDFAPPPPPAPRGTGIMPPISVLSAPPPPPPGSMPEPPPAPGGPRLSFSTAAPDKSSGASAAPKVKGATEAPLKVGGKPVVKPGKGGKPPSPEAVLGKRSNLSTVAKAGIAVLAMAILVGVFYSYRIFFPAPTQDISLKVAAPVKPVAKAIDSAAAAIASKRSAEQAKVDAAAAGDDTPTPTPAPAATTESVLEQTDLSSDVKVNSTHLDAATAASSAFRNFVANASIGGVFQGTPSRALINGSIMREGQVVESSLGIAFERIDADKKVIYFKDSTGAEVSKNY